MTLQGEAQPQVPLRASPPPRDLDEQNLKCSAFAEADEQNPKCSSFTEADGPSGEAHHPLLLPRPQAAMSLEFHHQRLLPSFYPSLVLGGMAGGTVCVHCGRGFWKAIWLCLWGWNRRQSGGSWQEKESPLHSRCHRSFPSSWLSLGAYTSLHWQGGGSGKKIALCQSQ